MKISVIGTGYVGLVVGTCFAEGGNDVICVDVDKAKVQMLRRGKTPIYEPSLEEFLKRNIHEGRLSFTTNLEQAIRKTDVVFLALPTPQSEDGSADLKHVKDVARKIGKCMNGYKVIVNKSTVPVGTANEVRRIVSSLTKHEFDVVSNPEFLKEGVAVNDFMKPDRVVVGSSSPKAIKIMQDLFAPFVRTGNPVLVMDERSAEITKYAANAFLATKISFMNEIANLCDRVGADVDMIRKGIGSDPRIGMQFLFPGVGYGGSCFPKDVSALERTAHEYGYDFQIVRATQKVNSLQKKVIVRKIKQYFGKDLSKAVIGIWGLAFKPQTDDMREAPSISIIRELTKCGAKIRVHDPVAIEQAKRIFGSTVAYFENNYDAVKGADALVIVTEWNEFRRPDFERMKRLMRRHVIFDGRNIYDPKSLRDQGFVHFDIGRGNGNDKS